MLSIGSAAGVGFNGASPREQYTFFGHLKWTPVIALGYGGQYLGAFFSEWLTDSEGQNPWVLTPLGPGCYFGEFDVLAAGRWAVSR